jgi:hypothetical protein
MRTPRATKGMQGWEGVQENGRALKQAARVYKIPYVTGTQLNRDGETSYQSAQKIADMLLVLLPDEEDEAKNEMRIIMRKYRDGPSRKTVTMRWNLERMDIKEKGIEERFPAKIERSLKSESKRKKLQVAEVIHDRPNPWSKKKRERDQKERYGIGAARAKKRANRVR